MGRRAAGYEIDPEMVPVLTRNLRPAGDIFAAAAAASSDKGG